MNNIAKQAETSFCFLLYWYNVTFTPPQFTERDVRLVAVSMQCAYSSVRTIIMKEISIPVRIKLN